MKSIKTILAAVILILIAGLSEINAQKTSPCLALITGKKGMVMIKKSGQKEFIKSDWGAQLFIGDRVKTGPDSQASLTFSDGNILEMGPGSEVTVSGRSKASEVTGGNVKKISTAMMVDISTLASKRETKTDAGTLAGLRDTGTEHLIELTSPFNTLIKTDKPSFSWVSKKQYDRYVLNLYNTKGLVWSRKLSGCTFAFPDDQAALTRGESYFWNVEGEDLLENEKSGNFKFSVIPDSKLNVVKDQEERITKMFGNGSDSSTFHSILGTFYMNQGLLQDAIKEFQIISSIYPDASLPHEILGSLYSDTGNKDKAIEELQKALALSKTSQK